VQVFEQKNSNPENTCVKFTGRRGAARGAEVNLTPLCAVQRRRSSVGAIPTRQLSFQPVAIGAVVEVTKLPKPSVQRTA
jgi:hypothetical protein